MILHRDVKKAKVLNTPSKSKICGDFKQNIGAQGIILNRECLQGIQNALISSSTNVICSMTVFLLKEKYNLSFLLMCYINKT